MMRALPLAACLLLGACMAGPDYTPPVPSAPAADRFAEAGRTAAVSQDALPQGWWRLYDDPALDRLIEDALAYNTDIRQAAANLQRSRAVLSEARSNRLPTTDAYASAQRVRTNGSSSSGSSAQAGNGEAGSFETDYFQLGLDSSYQLDLFGGVARAVEAARGDAEAAEAQLDAARVAVVAETVRSYLAACSNAAQAGVAAETVALQNDTLALTTKLFDAGRGTRRDVRRASVQLEQTRAQLPAFEAERRAALYALATLTGRPPAQVDPAASACTAPPSLTRPIPVGDGAQLLRRRPDVRAAERTLAADTARVGVAIADLYPSISILGSIGLGGSSIGDVGKSDSLSFSAGPLISWNFPNQSAARSRVRQARANADASLAEFDGTVLAALREVEQALARYDGAIRRNASLRKAEADSEDAVRLSRLRFDYGADSFLQLIDGQSELAAVRAARAQSDAALAEAQVALFNALGGGWEQPAGME